MSYPLADSETDLNKGPIRYTERSFPSYRYIPGLHPHPVNSSEGHSYGDEEVENIVPGIQINGVKMKIISMV